MNDSLYPIHALRFGTFEVDLRARELRKRGVRLRLQEKPFQVLETLLERAGELVTREDLCHLLWPDTHVGFDRSLNTAVSMLRHTLGDSANNPRFVETCQRRGYRFIAPVERLGNLDATSTAGAIASIAMLPLRNETCDINMEHLSDNITDSVIRTLSGLPGVRVMARSTVFRFKGDEIDPCTTGRQLNVQAVLIGSVRLHGDELDVSLEAVDVKNGWHLWGEQFHGRPSELSALREAISQAISNTLRLRLSQG